MQEENGHITEEEISSLLKAARLTAWSQLDQLSPAQQEELENWLQQHPRHQQWWTELTRTGRLPELAASYQSLQAMAATEFEKFDRAYLTQPVPGEATPAPTATPVRRISIFRRSWVAASVILLLGVGTYLWQANKTNTLPPASITDISPGGDGAILTLANGKQVVLDSLANGLIAVQKGAQAMIRNGELVYDASGAAGEIMYNTMSTPKGRQFRLQLPDGTRVWLNAASSIRYPTAFTGEERKVEITGEAYFEVAKAFSAGGREGLIPFRVNVRNKAEVEVLGTHFNINAYENEKDIQTTLLEGSVRVTRGNNELVLKPDQQALIPITREKIQLINHADIDKVMAWKNGLFYFEGLTLEEAMRQLERWYNIEVIYEGAIPNIRFGGKMRRDITLSGLLQLLSDSQLKFRLEEGRRLIVLQ
jgi:transmembrane sensor